MKQGQKKLTISILITLLPSISLAAICDQDADGNYVGSSCQLPGHIVSGIVNLGSSSAIGEAIQPNIGIGGFDIGNVQIGTLNIASGSSLTIHDSFNVGKNTDGTLNINNGKISHLGVTNKYFVIADNNKNISSVGFKGILNATGSNAIIETDAKVYIGNWLPKNSGELVEGVLNLSNGALFHKIGSSEVIVGFANGGGDGGVKGTININNATFNGTHASLIVGHGSAGEGSINIINNGYMQVKNAIIGNLGAGYVSISNNSKFIVGSELSPQSIDIAKNVGSNGRLVIGATYHGDSSNTSAGVVVGDILFGKGDAGLIFNHNSNNYVFSNKINGGSSSTASLLQEGVGTTELTNVSNDYTADNTIRGGTLKIGDDRVLGNLNNIILFDTINNLNGTLQISQSIESNRNITMIADGSFWIDDGKTYTLNGDITGAGGITITGAGTMIVNGDNAYDNATHIVNYSTLRAGKDNTFSVLSDHKIEAGSSLQLDGTHQTIRSLYNSGTVNLSHLGNDSLIRGNLNIVGNYKGNNGKLIVNTMWNTDGSTSDKLIISGNAEGNTFVSTPTGIIGDVMQTTQQIYSDDVISIYGNNNSIFVGSAQTTNAGEAQLVKKDNNIYAWTIFAKKDDDNSPDPEIPIYSTAVPAYVLMNHINFEQNYTTIGRLHKRRVLVTPFAISADQDQTWGRTYGESLEQNGKNRFNFKSKMYGFQIGHDFRQGERSLISAYLSYNHAETKFYDKYRSINGLVANNKYAGDGESDIFSLGVTNTYYNEKNGYIDLVGQLSYLRNKYSPLNNTNYTQRGWGLAASIEVGQPFILKTNENNQEQWLIEPQAQIIYQYIDLNNINDGIRKVTSKNKDGLRGRAGIRLAYNSAESFNTIYMTANILHDFLSSQNTQIGRDNLKENYSKTWGEIGVGAEISFARNGFLYGEINHERNFGSIKRKNYRGTIGLKYTW